MKYPDCVTDLVVRSLEVHLQTQHVVDAGGIQQWETPLFPQKESHRSFGCHSKPRRDRGNAQSRGVGGRRR